jgi:FecR protein
VFIEVWIRSGQTRSEFVGELMKRIKQSWPWALVLVSLAFLLQPLASTAQDAQAAPDAQSADQQDPPSRVARLNYMEGSVSFQPGGENDWVTAELNRPLVTGDNLWADENSRAELHIGSTALRLGPKTGITLLEVSDQVAQIRLVQGSLIVNVRHVDDENAYEIDTPNVAFVVMQPGDYRMDVDPDGSQTDVTVWRGRAEVTGGGNTYSMGANQYARFTGDANDQVDYSAGDVPNQDGLDSWAQDRDQNEDRSDAANYVSRDMTGYEDLDQYGDWSYVADYGMVWRPTAEVPGWAPYRYGNWTWVAPWGWTWVENEPWGFAPFHYGRWASSPTGWVWVPGPSMVRPVYAPALVSWAGGGPGFHFSAGVGVAWFPLAPGEVFIPGYHVSRAYVNSVNVTNTAVNVTRVANVYNAVVVKRDFSNITYANRNVSGGVTAVSQDTFVNGRPVARNVMPVPSKELAAAPVSNALAVEPTRTSVFGAGKPVANKPPATVMNRPVVALRTPAPLSRTIGPGTTAVTAGSASPGQNSTAQSLVRQQAPGRPVPVTRPMQSPTQSGFHTVGETETEGSRARTQPHVWEEQGSPTPEPPPRQQSPRNRNVQSSASRATQAPQQGMRPSANPARPVQAPSELQPKPAPSPQRQQTPHAPAPKPESASAPAPKKGH